MTLQGKAALVTGASGFVGGALALRLAAEGTAVHAFVRQTGKAGFLHDQPNVTVMTGSLTDWASLRAAAAGCDYVFHCAAALGGSLSQQRRTNSDGTRNLMHAAADAGVRRVVHVSTLSVYGVLYRGVITEDQPPAPVCDPYSITKAEAEEIVRKLALERGLEYTIARPGMIYGPRSQAWTRLLFQIARLRPRPILGDGGGLAHCIHIDDVVELLLLLADHPQAQGEVFNACSDPSPTWKAFVGEYARLAHGVNDDWVELPRWLLYGIGGLVMLLSPLHSPGRMLPDYVSFALSRHQFSMAKARSRLGWQPQVSLQEGVARCADWLRAEGLLNDRSG